jgi:hypothetical protein
MARKLPSIKQFLDSEYGSILISVIVGLGLATLFRKACKGYGCHVIRGPPLSELRKNVYLQDGRCWKYTPEAADCAADQKP